MLLGNERKYAGLKFCQETGNDKKGCPIQGSLLAFKDTKVHRVPEVGLKASTRPKAISIQLSE